MEIVKMLQKHMNPDITQKIFKLAWWKLVCGHDDIKQWVNIKHKNNQIYVLGIYYCHVMENLYNILYLEGDTWQEWISLVENYMYL